MHRREFIAGLGAAITGSIQTDAQELPSVPLVGYLDDGPAEGFIFRQVEFRKGLAAADYYEGCNVAIESHWARLPDWASDLVDRGVAVLVASGNVSSPRKRQPRRFRLSSASARTPSRPASFPALTIREATSPVSPP
jgi:hypothetical protein